MNDCLFCKLINGEIPSEKVYEDEFVLAFKDIEPKAPVHILVIPKAHIDSAASLSPQHSDIIVKIMLTLTKLADELKLEKGWRIVSNVGDDGGQTVKHLHFHLLGGKKLRDFG